MKILAGTTLALALSVASVCPVFTGPALSQTDTMMTRGQVTGQIDSIDGSTVTVRSPDGSTRTYEIDPAVIASLRLGQGSTISINNSNLMSGEIIRIGPRNALVKLDNGETENFIVTREGRVTISPGDRVIITPDQRITRAENYILGAGDVTSVQPTATTTDTTSTVRSTEVETGTTTEVAPSTTSTTTETVPPASSTPAAEETQPAQQPVRALW